MRPIQEDIDRAVETLELLLRAQNFEPSQQMALLDSGASHPYRTAKSNREHQEAKRVAVQLASAGWAYCPAEADKWWHSAS